MNCLERITFNPQRCGGSPCVRGTRIRVKDVLGLLAAGLSENDILESYPDLEADDIKACPSVRGRSSRPCRASGGVKSIIDARLPPTLSSLPPRA